LHLLRESRAPSASGCRSACNRIAVGGSMQREAQHRPPSASARWSAGPRRACAPWAFLSRSVLAHLELVGRRLDEGRRLVDGHAGGAVGIVGAGIVVDNRRGGRHALVVLWLGVLRARVVARVRGGGATARGRTRQHAVHARRMPHAHAGHAAPSLCRARTSLTSCTGGMIESTHAITQLNAACSGPVCSALCEGIQFVELFVELRDLDSNPIIRRGFGRR